MRKAHDQTHDQATGRSVSRTPCNRCGYATQEGPYCARCEKPALRALTAHLSAPGTAREDFGERDPSPPEPEIIAVHRELCLLIVRAIGRSQELRWLERYGPAERPTNIGNGRGWLDDTDAVGSWSRVVREYENLGGFGGGMT